jgi:lysozyme family protein
MSAFDRAVELVLSLEGVSSDHPNDHGSATRWGISQRAYPTLDLDKLTRAGAITIYRKDYWNRILGDDLPPALALVLFDWSVHAGVSAAVTRLQRLVGATQDGKLGRRTLAAALRFEPATLVLALLHQRSRELVELAEKPGQGVFKVGWMARLATVAMTAGQELQGKV